MGKWAKPDLSDLDYDLSNNSIKSTSWQLINIIRKKLHAQNNKKLLTRFWENWHKVAKLDLFRTLKNDLYSDSIESIFWQFI